MPCSRGMAALGSRPSFGQPLLADPSAQVLYPLTWLNLLMRPWIYYTLFSMLHALLARSGSYRFARHLGVSPRARSWRERSGFSRGPSSPWSTSGTTTRALPGSPGCCWPRCVRSTARVRARRAVRSRHRAPGLAGSADLSAMTLLTVAAYALVFKLDWRDPRGAVNRRLVGVGAGAPRSARDLGCAVDDGAGPRVASSRAGTSRKRSAPTGRCTRSPRSSSCFPGSSAVLARAGARRSSSRASPSSPRSTWECRRSPSSRAAWRCRRMQSGSSGSGSPGRVLVSLGRHAFFYQLGQLLVPPLRILRYPVKALVLASFAVAILAGLGFDAWRAAATPKPRRWRLGLLLPLLLVGFVGVTGALLFYWDAVQLGASPGGAGRGALGPRTPRLGPEPPALGDVARGALHGHRPGAPPRGARSPARGRWPSPSWRSATSRSTTATRSRSPRWRSTRIARRWWTACAGWARSGSTSTTTRSASRTCSG